jgi:hypothetical protein
VAAAPKSAGNPPQAKANTNIHLGSMLVFISNHAAAA